MSALAPFIDALKGRTPVAVRGSKRQGPRRPFVDSIEPVSPSEKWSPATIYKIVLYFGFCFVCLDLLPNNFWDPATRRVTVIIGVLGVWRYGWWFNHAIRAQIYRQRVYPGLRKKAQAVWADGWRPRHVHFMMTTFKEHREVTERVVQSICSQLRQMGVPGTLWLGSGDICDEQIIETYLKQNAGDLVGIRDDPPKPTGQRLAIGLVLRGMNRARVHDDDVIVFMDGDSILGEGCVQKCAALMVADPELQAVTTDEEVVCYGPNWIRTWLTMRFAQRRIAMMSHALSNKVLTLTGRMSVFRARHLRSLKLIRLLEADHLDNWLWGNFRFLSGDDKSTWYYMLTQDAKMLYVPDAMAYTVEYIEGNGIDRMVQNFRRWSGNMLRNGTRALLLGPRKIGFFIWWCIWINASPCGPCWSVHLAMMTSTLYAPTYLITYVIWISMSRMMLAWCFIATCPG